ncbi:MAG: YXWGXW repeat-containing protein [Vulcanimicrobiaceae bacterium]
MERPSLGRIAAAVVFGSLLASTAGPASAQVAVSIQIGPPVPVYEPIPPPPAAYLVWVPGWYRWDEGRYEWHPGYYARPPFPGAFWVPGRWQHGHGWHYAYGYWRHGDDEDWHGHGDRGHHGHGHGDGHDGD